MADIAAPDLAPAALRGFRHLVESARRLLARHSRRNQLRDLDEHILADIGLARTDIPRSAAAIVRDGRLAATGVSLPHPQL